MRYSIYILFLLLFSLKANGKDFSTNSCVETVQLTPSDLFEVFDIKTKGKENILLINGQVTRWVAESCNSDSVDEFWLKNGGKIREAKLYLKPIKTEEGLCKSKYISYLGSGESWKNFRNDEGFFISKKENCLDLPISEYIKTHSFIPDDTVNYLLSSVQLAKKHLKASEKIDVKNMRLLALGIGTQNDNTNYYMWLGIPNSDVWYELPVRLSYSDSSISFSKIIPAIQ